MRSRSREPQPAVLVGLQPPGQTEADLVSSLEELRRLAEPLGFNVVHTLVQRRASLTLPSPLGEGKLRELEELVKRATPRPTVLVDVDLTPGQHRVLERTLEVMVLDRTSVILRTFAARAQTREARLEVEIAQLTHDLPRIRDNSELGDREGGGGRGGRGHTEVELAKQRVRDRLAQLRRELDELRRTQQARRARRQDAPRVALVGYTNAGKSSLMRALTGSDVLVKDQLFATLGTTVRALQPEHQPRILVSDTVGFIRNLSHELLASFRSTLDEAHDAGLLLLVVDAADPELHTQLEVTRAVLRDLGAADIPARVILNKIDCVDDAGRALLRERLPDALQLSALVPTDVAILRNAIIAHFDQALVRAVLRVPWARGAVVGDLRNHARVLEEKHTAEATVLTVLAAPAVLARARKALADDG